MVISLEYFDKIKKMSKLVFKKDEEIRMLEEINNFDLVCQKFFTKIDVKNENNDARIDRNVKALDVLLKKNKEKKIENFNNKNNIFLIKNI